MEKDYSLVWIDGNKVRQDIEHPDAKNICIMIKSPPIGRCVVNIAVKKVGVLFVDANDYLVCDRFSVPLKHTLEHDVWLRAQECFKEIIENEAS